VKRIIINRPELQSPLQRITTRGITFVFWVLWIYLWLPLISLAAWWVGIRLFREHLLDNDGYKILFDDMHQYAIVVAVIAVVLIGWARYNLVRFRDKGSRKSSLPVDLATQAQTFKVESQQLDQWQRTKRLVVHHDERGNITQIETGMPPLATNDDSYVRAEPSDQIKPPPNQA
jgi:biofilm PGA synthesis protein PgaD